MEPVTYIALFTSAEHVIRSFKDDDIITNKIDVGVTWHFLHPGSHESALQYSINTQNVFNIIEVL